MFSRRSSSNSSGGSSDDDEYDPDIGFMLLQMAMSQNQGFSQNGGFNPFASAFLDRFMSEHGEHLRSEPPSSVNEVGSDGKTLLQKAVEEVDFLKVRQLIHDNARVNDTGGIDETPLHLAILSGNTRICEFLINNGANMDKATSMNRSTPLHYACMVGSNQIVKLLVVRAININARNSDSSTPLHIAVISNALEIVHTLLKYHADPNLLLHNYNGTMISLPPLHIACERGYLGMVKLLCEFKAVLNYKDMYQYTPVFKACSGGHMDIVKFLVCERCVDTTIQVDGKEITALQYAQKYGNTNIVHFLTNYNKELMWNRRKRVLLMRAFGYDHLGNRNHEIDEIEIEIGKAVSDETKNTIKTSMPRNVEEGVGKEKVVVDDDGKYDLNANSDSDDEDWTKDNYLQSLVTPYQWLSAFEEDEDNKREQFLKKKEPTPLGKLLTAPKYEAEQRTIIRNIASFL